MVSLICKCQATILHRETPNGHAFGRVKLPPLADFLLAVCVCVAVEHG